jgi:predicted AAA+ superfamily ATPase
MFWKRSIAEPFHRLRRQFPAVLVTGPRQSGKTTFLCHEAGDAAYVSFDDPLQRQFAAADPNGFLDQFREHPVVLDEVQYVPELFSYLKLRIDTQRGRNGRFLMSGSQQFQMMKHVTDSLAGRIAILDLLPFARAEIVGHKTLSLPDLIWRGGYPPVALQPERREAWLSAYVQTYVERDLRQLQAVKDLRAFELFLGLCAARHGQELNLADLGRHSGVTHPTARAWLSLLEASYVLWLLPPYFRNLGKRLVKTPKAYFVDSALAAHLTRQPDAAALWHGAMGGAFFEGWAVLEAVKAFAARGRRPSLYFWRSNDGLEVDLLVETGGRVHAVEIKRTATPLPGHARGLTRLRQLLGEKMCGECLLVCNVDSAVALPDRVRALPWRDFPAWVLDTVK